MSIFNNNKMNTSNDIYEAYKSEIIPTEEKKEIFSFANILKVEIALFVAGLFFMQQNNISIEFKIHEKVVTNSLPVSMQGQEDDSDLVVSFADETPKNKVASVEIREDDYIEALDLELNLEQNSALADDVYAQNDEMKSLIESLNLEVKQKLELRASL